MRCWILSNQYREYEMPVADFLCPRRNIVQMLTFLVPMNLDRRKRVPSDSLSSNE